MATAANPLPILSASLMSGQSSSIQIVAGANANSTNPLATSGSGSVTLDGNISYVDVANSRDILQPTTIRTGSGDIAIVAGGNITTLDAAAPAVIYTAGTPVAGASDDTAVSIVTAVSGALGSPIDYVLNAAINSDDAGNITLIAGGNITGIEQVTDTTGNVTGKVGYYYGQFWGPWLTANSADTSVPWYVNFSAFDQGILSLGGNVTVKAGGNISDLSVSLPTTSYVTTESGVAGTVSSLAGNSLVYTGGGVLTVAAGGNISSGSFYVGQGSGTITAGNAIASDFSYYDATTSKESTIATLLAVQNGTIAVAARSSIDIGGIYDPTYIGSDNSAYTPMAVGLKITSMTADSGVAMESTAGSIDFNSLRAQAALFAYGTRATTAISANTATFTDKLSTALLPASLSLIAVDGGITIGHGGGLFPSATGDLTVIADGTISYTQDWNDYWVRNVPTDSLTLLDYPLNTGILPSALDTTQVDISTAGLSSLHDPALLLRDDTANPVRVYSLDSDISDLYLVANKPAQIYAGSDIVSLIFYGQNDSASDITRITAGGSIIQDMPVSSNAVPPIMELAGPGDFDIEAGASILLGSSYNSASSGIRTIGNLTDTGPAAYQTFAGYTSIGYDFGNPWLPTGGASVSVLFGVGKGVDYADFIERYLDPATASAQGFLGSFATVMANYESGIGLSRNASLTAEQAWALFESLPALRQQLIAQQVFFQILNQTGLDYNTVSNSYYHQYARGYAAINTLFPVAYGYTENSLNGGGNGANAQASTGNLDLRGTTIQTQRGGDIALIGPGGNILVGTQAAAPSTVKASNEGIITFESGNISTFTDQSVDVAQSRIMTEQGGDILMWSSNGDLDAGKGYKTTYSFPPPVYLCDVDGYCVEDVRGLATGAGIASLQTIARAPVGDANLIAPRGTVDAGAAGIRVSGNLNVAALHVANAFNIQVQGVTTGVPVAVAPNLGALTAASDTAGSASNAADAASRASRQTGPRNSDLPSIITIEVIGYGGGDGTQRPDDKVREEERRRKTGERQSYNMNSAIQLVGNGPLTEQQKQALTREERQSVDAP
jgi:hypothetical protein